MRLLGRIWENGHVLRDTVAEDDGDDTRTHKVFHCLHDIVMEFDLPEPIWLESNIREFQRRSKTRFNGDCFVEDISFDWLEIQIIEE